MKKIVLGILSLLLITPVFADNIDLNRKLQSYISFESLNSSNNITYGTYVYNDIASTNPSSFYYLDSSLNPDYSISYYSSPSTQIGSSFDSSLDFPFLTTGDSLASFQLIRNYFGYLGIGFNNNKLLRNQFSIYFQASNQSNFDNYSGNHVLNFGGRFSSGINYLSVGEGFVRAFYNYNTDTELWFKNSSYPLFQFPTSPTDIQLFTKGNNSFFTTKGRASVNNVYYSKISPSVGNGFSFVDDLSSLNQSTVIYDDLNFYSVLPYWDISWPSTSSVYSLSSNSYIKGVYIFKNNALGRNSDFQDIGVISKCNIDLCSGFTNDFTGFLNSLVVSNYICDFSQNFGLKNNCILVGGGILYNIFNGLFTGLNSEVSISSLPYLFKPFPNLINYGGYDSLGVNFNFGNSPYSLQFSYFSRLSTSNSTKPRIYTDTYNIIYTGGYSLDNPPDILGVIDFIQDLPDNPTDSVGDLMDLYCNQNPTSPYCNGIYTGSFNDVRCVVNNSGIVNCYFTDYSRPTTSEECPTINSGLENGQTFIQYWSTGENRCIQGVSTTIEDSSPDFVSDPFESGGEYSDMINLAFAGILSGFNIHQCPFNSPFGVLRLGTIGGLSSFLLNKFYDVNIIGPFSCLLGGTLYSTSNSQSLSYSLVHYDGNKFLNSWSDTSKEYLNYLLMALIVILFWRFRPNSNSDH